MNPSENPLNRFRTTEKYTNSYGMITIGQLDQFQVSFGAGYQIDAYTPYSINDISGAVSKVKTIPFTMDNITNMLLTGGTRTDIAWTTNRDSINNSIAWIWGDLINGGVGLMKCSNTESGRLNFVQSNSVYYDEEHDYEKVGFKINETITPAQLSDVSFNWWFNEDGYVFDAVYCICRKADNSLMIFKNYTETLLVPSYSDPVETTFLSSLFNNSWLTYLGNEVPRVAIVGSSIAGPDSGGTIAFYPFWSPNFGEEYIPLGDIYGGEEDEEQENEEGGISISGGGGGGFDSSSDGSNEVGLEQFAIDAINSGFVTIYMPSKNNVQAFSDFLFSGIDESMSIVLKRLVSNPLDYVVSLNMIHFTPATSASQEIKFCGIGSDVIAPVVTSQFHKISCGEFEVNEQFMSALDYAGHSKISIYAPYCGIFPLNINDVMGGKLKLNYIIDLLTGSCVAQLYVTRYRNYVYNDANLTTRLLYEFTGNVFEQVPLSAVDYRGTIQGLMQIASGVSSVASGQSSGLGAIASGVMNMAPDVVHSGNASTSYGYMGVQKPFLILERQCQNLPYDFGAREGYVSNIYTRKLNDCSGYTEIDIESFKTEFIKCTDAERDELIKILSGGFII